MFVAIFCMRRATAFHSYFTGPRRLLTQSRCNFYRIGPRSPCSDTFRLSLPDTLVRALLQRKKSKPQWLTCRKSTHFKLVRKELCNVVCGILFSVQLEFSVQSTTQIWIFLWTNIINLVTDLVTVSQKWMLFLHGSDKFVESEQLIGNLWNWLWRTDHGQVRHSPQGGSHQLPNL